MGSGRVRTALGVPEEDEELNSERRASIAAASTEEGSNDIAASKRTAGTVKRAEVRIFIIIIKISIRLFVCSFMRARECRVEMYCHDNRDV